MPKKPFFSDRFKFAKPKTPGFGISTQFYLSVLSPRPTLPSIRQIAEPKGEGGAVVGFGAPLEGGNDPSLLDAPLKRGAYVIAAKDRKTVLRMLVMPKEEAGYDPEVVARSALSLRLSHETLDRLRATWMILQISFEAHDPSVYPSLDFILEIALRVGELVGGVIADPISQRFLLPNEVRVNGAIESPIDARNFVSLNALPASSGNVVRTYGLQKFSLPELQIAGVSDSVVWIAEAFLIGLCQNILMGHVLVAGALVGSKSAPVMVAHSGNEFTQYDGIGTYELIPKRGKIDECLVAWSKESGAD